MAYLVLSARAVQSASTAGSLMMEVPVLVSKTVRHQGETHNSWLLWLGDAWWVSSVGVERLVVITPSFLRPRRKFAITVARALALVSVGVCSWMHACGQ